MSFWRSVDRADFPRIETVNARQRDSLHPPNQRVRGRDRGAHRDIWRAAPHAEEWLPIESPKGVAEPTKYWFSTLFEDIA